MSIPPLVCSTPPPPDQCEDDKDSEDFDVQYNLSPDDDDENYDYGDFSTYNHLQYSKNSTEVPVMTTVVENAEKVVEMLENVPEEEKKDVEFDLGTNSNSECNQKVDEETNVEDLNLKLDATLASTDITDSKDTSVKNDPDNLNIQTIPDPQNPEFSNASSNLSICPPQSEELASDQPSLEQEEDLPSYVDEVIAAVEESLHVTVQETEKCSTAAENYGRQQLVSTTTEDIPVKSLPKPDEDDDFGDFDDFQFTSTTISVVKPVSLVSCDNPWDNIESTDNDDFGDFKANFEGVENNVNMEPEIKTVHSTEVSSSEDKKDPIETVQNDDDDFGDFNDYNDFQTSSTDLQWTAADEELYGPFWENLDMTDEEIVENANKVFDTLFMEEEDEDTESEREYNEKKLESVLGEVWGHILDVETRQPYMVNWNNSLSQKTVLKSLCIDSRNILFGPRWSYNMPKYAANLSVAPLQPLKQVAPVASSSDLVTPEKAVTKPTSTWSDPFTSDGQESCNTESRSENPAIEIGPTDLDVFQASTSSKSDKIFSSTISVQPLRQISLPDTHIFTPTDSETPRSTTIHYDNSPTVILSQTALEKGKSEPQMLSPQPSTSTAIPKEDDDYWEFQDFKGTSSTVPPSVVPALNRIEPIVTNPNGSLRTQMLQPIKIEPIMPKLNWPDPGEVKETFDDFTDFISSSSVNSQPSTKATTVDIRPTTDDFTAGPSKSFLTPEKITDDSYDDEFNTFQSALPSTSMDMNFPSTSGISNVAASKQISTASHIVTDFESAFPKIDNIKSDTISFDSTTKPKDNFVQNQMPSFSHNLEAKKMDFTVKTSPIQTTSLPMMGANLLQPTPATSSAVMKNQQKSNQILQPLSLESYSQINWPNPGMDLQDLSRFNPVETLQSLKSDLNVASPVHSQKGSVTNQVADSDDWGEFVSSKPKQPATAPKKPTTFADDDEWTDFVSSPGVKPQNGLNTISLNVHTNIHNSNSSKFPVKSNQLPLDIPTLNYITPKSTSQKAYTDRHFQNL